MAQLTENVHVYYSEVLGAISIMLKHTLIDRNYGVVWFRFTSYLLHIPIRHEIHAGLVEGDSLDRVVWSSLAARIS